MFSSKCFAGEIYEKNGKYGYKGQYKYKFISNYTSFIRKNLPLGDLGGIKYSTKTKKYVISPTYDKIKEIKENLLIVEKDNKQGIIYEQKFIAPVEYDNIEYLTGSSLFITQKNNFYGFIYYNNKNIFHCIPPEYDNIKAEDRNLIITLKNSYTGAYARVSGSEFEHIFNEEYSQINYIKDEPKYTTKILVKSTDNKYALFEYQPPLNTVMYFNKGKIIKNVRGEFIRINR